MESTGAEPDSFSFTGWKITLRKDISRVIAISVQTRLGDG